MKDENLAVRVAGLTKSYQGRTVLNGLDLAARHCVRTAGRQRSGQKHYY